MAKKKLSGNSQRKRSNVKTEQPVNVLDLRPISPMEVQVFQQLIDISNQYGKLRHQYEEYNTVLNSLKERRKKIQTGEIELPILMPLSKNKYYQCNDKKMILKEMDNEIDIISNALKGVEGQLTNHRDSYIEAGLAVRNFADNKFSKYKPKNTYSVGCSPKKEEKVLFEGELDEILKDEEKRKEFRKASEKAIKENAKM